MAYISLKEYATKHGKAHITVRQRCAAGTLPAIKNGKLWLIEEDEPYTDNRCKEETERMTTDQSYMLGKLFRELSKATGDKTTPDEAMSCPVPAVMVLYAAALKSGSLTDSLKAEAETVLKTIAPSQSAQVLPPPLQTAFLLGYASGSDS